MEDYLDSVDSNEPGVANAPQDFLYRDIRDKHPELERVSKREYANNISLQDELEGTRINGTTYLDDYGFDNNLTTDGELTEGGRNNEFLEISGYDDSDQYGDELSDEEIFGSSQEFAYGGEDNEYAFDEFTEFEGGGTHEENSLGGIPIGYGSNGKMNTVEEGETRYNFDEGGYIFSNRINTKGLFKDFK